MPSNHTPNYQLSQWERTDKVLMEDFNADNAKIDGALTELAQRTDSVESTLAGMSNCRVYMTSYTGDGVCKLENSPRIELPAIPDVLVIIGAGYIMYHQPASGDKAYIISIGIKGYFGVKWEGSTVILQQYSNTESSCMNTREKYFVFALYQAQ